MVEEEEDVAGAEGLLYLRNPSQYHSNNVGYLSTTI
jgi:hypothetical protein